MTRLNQIIAVEKGVKTRTTATLTEAHRTSGKLVLLSGLTRTYQSLTEDGDQLPPESTRVQLLAANVVKEAAVALVDLFDVTATKNLTNTAAKADIVVDGVTLATGVPVSTLLFLEKQLADWVTYVRGLPALDPSEAWTYDEASGVWRTEPIRTLRTRKTPRNHTKAEATDRHPAQVEMYYEDVAVGTWTTTKFSGALPATRVRDLVVRGEALLRAVKFAREEANGADVVDQRIGRSLFGYLLGDTAAAAA